MQVSSLGLLLPSRSRQAWPFSCGSVTDLGAPLCNPRVLLEPRIPRHQKITGRLAVTVRTSVRILAKAATLAIGQATGTSMGMAHFLWGQTGSHMTTICMRCGSCRPATLRPLREYSSCVQQPTAAAAAFAADMFGPSMTALRPGSKHSAGVLSWSAKSCHSS